jgi:hypothetical protein
VATCVVTICFAHSKRFSRTFLQNQDQLVVVDNTAGMDSVGAGIPACLDVAVVCVEPTLHSMKVGRQVVEGLEREQLPISDRGKQNSNRRAGTRRADNLFNIPAHLCSVSCDLRSQNRPSRRRSFSVSRTPHARSTRGYRANAVPSWISISRVITGLATLERRYPPVPDATNSIIPPL